MIVTHINTKTHTHYCGRASSYTGIGLDCSILGNPYLMRDQSGTERDRVIAQYRVQLNRWRIQDSEEWKTLISLPHNAVLGCFCHPKACHCDVLAAAFNWHHTN